VSSPSPSSKRGGVGGGGGVGDAGDVVVGVDVGGTAIKSVLVDDTGTVRAEDRAATPRPGRRIAERVADAVAASVARLAAPAKVTVSAVGVVVPGIVDEDAGVGVLSENLGWRDAPLRDLFADRLRRPVAFGHDVRAGALAEAQLGAGRGLANIVFLAIGTGIAAGLYLDGRPYSAGGWAGELGHTDVGHGERCGCGAVGCLEAIASAAAVARRYFTRTGRAVRGSAEVLALATEGDRDAQRVWADAVDALAQSLAWVTTVLAPEAAVLGGGLAEAGDALLRPLTDRLAARLTFQRPPALLKAGLGDRAACIGSALLARSLLVATTS